MHLVERISCYMVWDTHWIHVCSWSNIFHCWDFIEFCSTFIQFVEFGLVIQGNSVHFTWFRHKGQVLRFLIFLILSWVSRSGQMWHRLWESVSPRGVVLRTHFDCASSILDIHCYQLFKNRDSQFLFSG